MNGYLTGDKALAAMNHAVKRPVLRWHGGKWKLAPWIIGHFPAHRVYVEPFGGAASVLLRKGRAYAEVYNDLDGGVVGLFRILRDPAQAAELERRLRLTPFARAEFELAYEAAFDAIDAARQLIVRSFMGFGSNSANPAHTTGFRADSNKSGSTPAHDWTRYPDCVAAFTARLAGVVIERRPALDVIAKHDGPDALHYVDPPYMHATRSRENPYCPKHLYAHEMSDADHAALLEALLRVEGMVVVSGYPAALYDDALKGWHRVEREALADGARPRTEVLWLNPACRRHGGLL